MQVFLTIFVVCVWVTTPALSKAQVDEEDINNPCNKFQWRCNEGSCISFDGQCDGVQDCPDGSDEMLPVCRESNCVASCERPTPAPSMGGCILPAYPEHGTYTVSNSPNAIPGQAFESLQLNVTCRRGYAVVGKSSVICFQGTWSSDIPKCELFCKLDSHVSVHYKCLVSGSIEGQRPCRDYEPDGTIVRPECNTPNYYSQNPLPFMKCKNGIWDKVATCQPECGRVTPDGEILVVGGVRAKKGELPWHAGIYKKTSTPYMLICGGSLISTNVVISAAHCFWSDVKKQLPAADYAVAVGKLYSPWDDKMDVDAQKSNVRSIYMPRAFMGGATNFQGDIAVVVVTTPFEYKTYVRPVCLSFDVTFERWQLEAGRIGKVAGWGLVGADGQATTVLQVTKLPYVETKKCYDSSPPGFKEYITVDKICAGYINNGSALCKGDSGGGLVFSDAEQGKERYYLRGIVSTAPNNEDKCNANTFTTFTRVIDHHDFIRTYT